eukprot:17156-Heterococcus_DN1.PRE.1
MGKGCERGVLWGIPSFCQGLNAEVCALHVAQQLWLVLERQSATAVLLRVVVVVRHSSCCSSLLAQPVRTEYTTAAARAGANS